MRRDFPFYAGEPIGIGFGRWTVLLLSIVAGFMLLEFLPERSFQEQLLARLLFVGIPLGTLIWTTGRHAKAFFGPIGAREVLIAALAALLAIVASFTAALVVRQFSPVTSNALAVGVAEMSLSGLVLNLLSAAPQLLGEELLTILPFIALLQFATARVGLGRSGGIAVALVGSTLVFCAAHLPTYDWNWAQCFGVIGASRIVLTLAYILTRNLWVSTGAHVLTDWTELAIAFAVAPRVH